MVLMDAAHQLALALDPSLLLTAQGFAADRWQREVLLRQDRQVLLNCCRQSGKSTTVAALALHTALFQPPALVLLLSPSQRQSFELFRKVREAYESLGRPVEAVSDSPSVGRLELANGSRIIGLPGKEATVRGFSRVRLLLIDEAAQVSDALYNAVRPMLAISRGRLVCLSTPFGQRGFFWREWVGNGNWHRVQVTHRECPRMADDFVASEQLALGKAWFDQEYLCLFTALEGAVYPEFEKCLIDTWPKVEGQAVGGLDWGWNNPFAAVWGLLDADDVLWLGWEHYVRQKTHLQIVEGVRRVADVDPQAPRPEQVHWYADPSGASDIANCNSAGWSIRKANNEIRLGIMAVERRLRTGRLKVLRSGCPRLIEESRLYRYPRPQEHGYGGETPVDCHNHALGALRYLVCTLDEHALARESGKRTVAVLG